MVDFLLRYRFRYLLAIAQLMLFVMSASAAVISTHVVWTLASSPILVAEDVTVAAGASLSVEPGVVVSTAFDALGGGSDPTAVELSNEGEMDLLGNPGQVITIGPAAPSDPAPIVRANADSILRARSAALVGDLDIQSGSTYMADPSEGISVDGQVSLAGDLGFLSTASTVPGETYLLIDKSSVLPVSGVFNGLPEGAEFEMEGAFWVISYEGGDGNDVSVTRQFDKALTLTPDPLYLSTNDSSEMTVTISNPAGVGGELVALSATGIPISVPADVRIPEGSTSANFTVASGADPGTGTVAATWESVVASATVNVAEVIPPNDCRTAARLANKATRTYSKSVKTVERSCKQYGDDCEAALSDLSAALTEILIYHADVEAFCRSN